MYQHWECVIIIDGLTDNTDKVAEQFIIKNSIFKYIQKNGGVASSRN